MKYFYLLETAFKVFFKGIANMEILGHTCDAHTTSGKVKDNDDLAPLFIFSFSFQPHNFSESER